MTSVTEMNEFERVMFKDSNLVGHKLPGMPNLFLHEH